MKLLVEGRKPAEDPNTMFVEGGFVVRTNKGEEDFLKKLKPSATFYPYIDETGSITHLGCLYRHDPIGEERINQSAFRSGSQFAYTIDGASSIFGTDEQRVIHNETLRLKGSRIYSPYLEIKKVQLGEQDKVPFAFISGKLYRIRDRRLDYLSESESTIFGKGNFSLDDVRAVWDGDFIVLKVSPYADKIADLVNQQKEAFSRLSSSEDNSEEKNHWSDKFKYTEKLLVPHAHEVYHIDGNKVYYVNSSGNWQVESMLAMRPLDKYDRIRIHNYLVKKGKVFGNLKRDRLGIADKNFMDRSKLDTLVSAFQPHILANIKKDQEEAEKYKEKVKGLTPHSGPLGDKDLPGLKKGTTLFPHQALVLAGLKDKDRILADIDPGGGKTIIMICDILQQMKAGKVKRPLVVMPESLLASFAQEVRDFSELNPWIISTDSVKRWKEEDLPAFIEDAKNAPHNTVYLTSYTWISLEPNEIQNGVFSNIEGEKAKYKTDKDFYRTRILLDELKVDAVYYDEVHILKSDSNMSRAAFELASAPIVRGMTGTIMPGHLTDITGSMSAIHSGVFGTEKEFLADYMKDSKHAYIPDAPKEIRQKLLDWGVISVRRSAWAHLLPKVFRQYHYVKFSDEQQKLYEAVLTNIRDEIKNNPKLAAALKRWEDAIARGDEVEDASLLQRFIPLDVFLNAPAEARPYLNSLRGSPIAVSPKVKMISDIARKHLAKDNQGKVLVFTLYKHCAENILDNLDADLRDRAEYYEGGMVDVLNRFKNPQDPLRILIGVDASLVVGHNIQAANCIIHADQKWLTGNMSQREARAVRIGQTRDVYIHNIIVRGAAEVLKTARLLSQEHTVAKANSDFNDKKNLQSIRMTLDNMTTFREVAHLEPYIDRQKTIQEHYEKQAVKDKVKFGTKLLTPRGYSSISDATHLSKVPSSKDFVGDAKDHDALVEKELNELPEDPKNPKKITLGLFLRDESWHVYSYKTDDPAGFLRRLGFNYKRGYYYIGLSSKSQVNDIVEKLEENLTITNKLEFERQVRETRVTERVIKRRKRRAKWIVTPKEVKTKNKGDVELHFGSFDGAAVIWIPNVYGSDDPELGVLNKHGFEFEPAYWERSITRSTLKTLFKKINTNYPQVKIADWDDFKDEVKTAFKGLDLTEFDDLAAKK